MEVVILPDAEAVAETCARIIVELVGRRPDCVLGLATGQTPVPTYRRLAGPSASGVHFDRVTAVALDEYIGLAADDVRSYRHYLLTEFASPLRLDPDRLHLPDVNASDLPRACAEYEQLLDDLGGVDLQLLGIGSDGHIGFNEPGSSLASRTRIKTLHAPTIADNSQFFASSDDVPRHVVTQGIGTILESRHAVLIATGSGKARAIAAAVEGPVTAMVPASALQLHPHVTVLVDEVAAGQLRLAPYYRSVHSQKPAWQSY